MAWHLLALLAVIAWTGVTSLFVLLPLLLCGKLRITDADERSGMDVKKIKEQSYHGSHCCDCKCKSNASHMPTIIVPRTQNKSTRISGSVIAPTTESSFLGAVSFPLSSPPSAAAQPRLSTELDSNPPSLVSTLLPEDSLPLDMEEVTLQTYCSQFVETNLRCVLH